MIATVEHWYVLIEEEGDHASIRAWLLTQEIPAGHSQEEARQVAAATARTFTPKHPKREQGRRVYRRNDDEWIVLVQGLTRSMHFRVTVAELVEAT